MNLAQHIGELTLRISDLEESLKAAGGVEIDQLIDAELMGANAQIERQRKVIAGLNERASRAEQRLAAAEAEHKAAVNKIAALETALKAVAKREPQVSSVVPAVRQDSADVMQVRSGGYYRHNAPARVLRTIGSRGGSWSFAQLRAALPAIPSASLSFALSSLFKRGMVEREGTRWHYRYTAKKAG